MPKPSSHYHCQQCGGTQAKWSGQCDHCGAWDSLTEESIDSSTPAFTKGGERRGHALTLTSLDKLGKEPARLSSGLEEFDRVLGGGLVPGAGILIGGAPGIGKSTLLLQAAGHMGASGIAVAYFSGEESLGQISQRAKRLGLSPEHIHCAATASCDDIIATLDKADAPHVAIIDSIQTLHSRSLDAASGSVSQVRAAGQALLHIAKKRHIAVLIVGHVTKEGALAGPRVLEHMVDVVLQFEGDGSHAYRLLRGMKNRFGRTDEIGVFSMTADGLAEVGNPSALFLTKRDEALSGSSVFAGMEGTRPVLVEIQALIAPTPMANPRRAVVGWDSARLSMMLAVLDARCGVSLAERDIYLNVAGGYRIKEPAADLAVVAALLSSLSDIPIPQDTVIFGEIGLSGEVRPVSFAEQRLRESAKLGFSRAIYPRQAASGNSKVKGSGVDHIHGLVERFYPAAHTRKEASGESDAIDVPG